MERIVPIREDIGGWRADVGNGSMAGRRLTCYEQFESERTSYGTDNTNQAHESGTGWAGPSFNMGGHRRRGWYPNQCQLARRAAWKLLTRDGKRTEL